MKYVILGAGGVGCYYGAKLLDAGCEVHFVARGKHLEALKQDGLTLSNSKYNFKNKIQASSFEEITSKDLENTDVIMLAVKSTATKQVAGHLQTMYLKLQNKPYILSIQNGVENEEVLCEYFPKEKIIGGLVRKIGAHIIKPGVVEVAGTEVETIIGAWDDNIAQKNILQKINNDLVKSNLICNIVENIKLELWKKLVINNGVNALCALLHVKTGVVVNDEKLSKIFYGLMNETAIAATNVGLRISKKDLDGLFALMLDFNSVKPSMLVDREFKRPLELEEICGVVLKNCEALGKDAPYTRTISSLLEFIYAKEV